MTYDFGPILKMLHAVGMGAPDAGEAAASSAIPQAMPAGPTGNVTADDISLPTSKPSLLRRFIGNMAASGGASPERVAEFKDPGRTERFRQLRAKQAQTLFPNDPLAQTLWATGDDEFTKAVSGNYKDQVVGEGSVATRNGKPIFRNPKTVVGQDEGVGYTGNDVDGITWGASRGPTYKERTGRQIADQTGAKNDADIENDQVKASVDQVIAKAARDINSLTPGELQIFQTWMESKKKPEAVNLFGAPASGGDDTPAAAPPKAPARKPLTPPAAKAPYANLKDNQTFKMKGQDGLLHRWQMKGGKPVDLGVVS